MKTKREDLAEALDGMLDAHQGEISRLLDQIAFVAEQIGKLTRSAIRSRER
jgi:hypothetical protein